MEKLSVEIAQEEAINAINDNKIVALLWGGKNTDNQEIYIEFNYPRLEGKINKIRLGLSDVRASDGIQIEYDFDRDGYSIKQPYYVDEEEKWKEMAFLQSWALEDDEIEELS